MQRQLAIHEKNKKECLCVACVNEYPTLSQQKIAGTINTDVHKYSKDAVITNIEAFNMFRENCKYIQDNFDDFPSQDISCRLIANKFWLDNKLSQPINKL